MEGTPSQCRGSIRPSQVQRHRCRPTASAWEQTSFLAMKKRRGPDGNSALHDSYCHQKAGCECYRFSMSKASKRLSQREGLKRWDDQGGAPRSGYPSHEPHLAPAHEAEPALYYFNLRTESDLIEDPEGDTYSSLQAAREDAVAKARDLIVEGHQNGEDRRGWRFEIMDRANQPVLTVSFAEVVDPEAT